MIKYLLDTNAYFAILKCIAADDINEKIKEVLSGECYISKATEIEIVSVIGKYARGSYGGIEVCSRVHEKSGDVCGNRYIIPKQKKWSQSKLKGWLKLEKEISRGENKLFNVKVLDIDNLVIREAEIFIQNAIRYNFKSMDAIIFGTAKANSTETEKMVIVTADKGLKAGMDTISYPNISIS